MGRSVSCEQYLIDFPVDKERIDQVGSKTVEVAELTFDGELGDSRAISLRALFAVYLSRYSGKSESAFRFLRSSSWEVEACRVNLELPLSAVEDTELPVAAGSRAPGVAVGLSIVTIDSQDVLSSGLDFVLYVEQGAQTRLRCYYNANCFVLEGVRHRLAAFAALLDGAINQPLCAVGDLPFASKLDEYLLAEIHKASVNVESEFPIHKRFELQARVSPDAEAVRFEGQSLSYRELNQRSNQLARLLAEKGIGRGVKVGLFLERSEQLLVALLGILKSGAAYIPVDPSYPAERIAYILEDSQAPLIITENALLSLLDCSNTLPLVIDDLKHDLDRQSSESLEIEVLARDPMYLIYTSGSTGKPKGVQISHDNAASFLDGMLSMPPLNRVDRTLSLTSLCFDVSVAEIYCTLLIGGCVVIASRAVATNPVALAHLIESEQVETMHATPSTWRLLLETGWSCERLVGVTAGEPFPRELLIPILQATKEFWNFYGPTEATVYATGYQLSEFDDIVHIGQPVPNYCVRICDKRGAPVPMGAEGELWIGGSAITRGYSNRDDLNRSQFPEIEGARFYRTGDLVRLRLDGNIENRGRLDDQIKINGYRIELGEVEAVLGAHPEITRAVVDLRLDESNEKQLVAWCQMSNGCDLVVSDIKNHLHDQLPPYMMPTDWQKIESVPLNPSGKVDRKALPNVNPRDNLDSHKTAEEVMSADDQVSTARDLWLELLSLEHCEIQTSFFELGGTSMLALQYVKRFNTATGSDYSIVDLFNYPNLQAWCDHIRTNKVEKAGPSADAPTKPKNSEQDIAIVGMAVHVPGARNLQKFWQNIVDGVESISHFSREELLENLPADLVDSPDYVPHRGVLKDFDAFDHDFFAVNPREAKVMDPQQRLFLQTAWHAFEDAAEIPDQFDGLVGVYAGTYYNTYHSRNAAAHEDLIESMGHVQEMIASEKDYVATRVAHKFNLKGPAISIHTACSTSMVAIAQACGALRLGQCDMALAGAASVTSPVASGHEFQEGGVFSRDGHTRSFSADASGTMFCDGVGAVVLKRVDDAVANGDRIYAVIKAAATNNDGGGKMSFMAPSSEGQAAVIETALVESGVSAETIGFLEAHGTATPVGDPIEVEGLQKAYGKFTQKKQFCAIGSVKSNVGHLTAAAGVAGLIKTALSLHHKTIPSSLHCDPVNPTIRFDRTPFYPSLKTQAWVDSVHPRRAGVSSFGVGGTNAHAILEEYLQPDGEEQVLRPRELLVFSAKTRESLDHATENMAGFLTKSNAAIGDVSHTLLHGRTLFQERRFVVTNAAQAANRLKTLDGTYSATSSKMQTSSKVAFMFPGQGSQYAGMGRNLYQSEAVYREAVDLCADLLQDELCMDIRDLLLAEGNALAAAQHTLDETRFTQPCLFVTGYALAQLWKSWGVEPAALIGHSVGEFVAAHLAGVFSLKDSLMLVARRGALMQSLPGGSMLSVRVGAEQLQSMLPESLSIAAVNGERLCVVAGTDEDVSQFSKHCGSLEIPCRALQTSHAFHSHMMDPIVDEFSELVAQTERKSPKISLMSTANADWHSEQSVVDPGYWAHHLRHAVRFSEGVVTLWQREDYVLLELGPRATATAIARQNSRDPSRQIAIPSLPDTSDEQREVETMLSAVGRLWQCGIALQWGAVQGELPRRVIGLPGYAFAKTKHWLPSRHALENQQARPAAVEAQPTFDSTKTPPVPNCERVSMTSARQSRKQNLIELVQELFEDTSGMELKNSEPSSSFMSLGLDSLFLTQAGNSVKKKFGVSVSFRQLMESLDSFEALATHLDSKLPDDQFLSPPVDAVPESEAQQVSHAVAGEIPLKAHELNAVQLQSAPVAPTTINAGVESLVQQQLIIMSQQLQLLGGSVQPDCKLSDSVSAIEQSDGSSEALGDVTGAKNSTQKVLPERVKVELKTQPFGAQARIEKKKQGNLTPIQLRSLSSLIAAYTARTKSSKAYAQDHRLTFSDPRVVSGFTPLLKEAVYPLVVNRSEGCRLWDIDDNEYIDITNCFGANFIGYGTKEIKEALHRQIDLGFEIGPTCPDSGEVARLACELTGNERFAFCNTGSEAVLGAVRAARSITARDVVVSFSGDYHGLFDEVIVRGSPSLKSFAAASGIPQSAVSQTLILDYGEDTALAKIRERADDIAAVLVEPVQSRNPGLQPREFLHKLRALTEELDIALIFDEVITGFRIHPGGAQAHFGVRADLATYGKIVGGGMPIGMIGGKAKYMDAFDGGQWQYGDDSAPEVGVTYLAGTFVRHPLTMAAAKALLTVIKEQGVGLYESVNARADRMAQELNRYFEDQEAPYSIANFGSLFKLAYPMGTENAELLFMFARLRGLHVWDGLPMALTAAHSDSDVDRVVEIFKASLDDMFDSGFLNGKEVHPIDGHANQRLRLVDGTCGDVNWMIRDDRQSGRFKIAK